MWKMGFSHPEITPVTNRIIGAAIEVHRILGPGLLESIYEECLCSELTSCGHRVERQKELPVIYKGKRFLPPIAPT